MNSETFDLSLLPVGRMGTVVAINAAGQEKERLTDMGFAPSLKVKTLFKSPAQDPIAYEVMGAVLALRREAASKIIVQADNSL